VFTAPLFISSWRVLELASGADYAEIFIK